MLPPVREAVESRGAEQDGNPRRRGEVRIWETHRATSFFPPHISCRRLRIFSCLISCARSQSPSEGARKVVEGQKCLA